MSGCYHICPNHSNFQFDTAFMYTIAILCMLKIYQVLDFLAALLNSSILTFVSQSV